MATKPWEPPWDAETDRLFDLLEESAQAENRARKAEQLAADRQQLLDERQRHHDAAMRAILAGDGVASKRARRVRGPKLSQVITNFGREKAARRAWDAKTEATWGVTTRLLVEGLGDVPIASVDRPKMIGFVERLRRLPANASKLPALRGLDFDALTVGGVGEPIARRTADAHVTRIAELFGWAMRHGLIERNPAEGLTVGDRHDDDDGKGRRAYSSAELALLFSSEDWRRQEFEYPWRYWVPLMAILTGMRLEEICQLSLKHFEEIDGVPVIKVGEPKAKNPTAKRKVPIHRELIELGLLDYVAKLRTEGKDRLFEELKAGRDGYGQPVSRWFGRFKEKCGIKTGELDFHSFRHMFISARMNAGNQQALVNTVTGHQIAGETKTYWTHRDAKALREVVNSVGLPEEVKELIPRFGDVKIVPGMGRGRRKRL